MAPKGPYYLTDDAHVGVWLDNPESDEPRKLFAGIVARLRKWGWAITSDPETVKHYPSLAKFRREGRKGDLCVRAGYHGWHIEVDFFLDRVVVNQAGNRYDFGRTAKFPYLTRQLYFLTRDRLAAWLGGKGIAYYPGRLHYGAGIDPLTVFNSGWGADRFSRGPDGWPDETELTKLERADGDGVRINHGDERYAQVSGRWVRARVYGGINGMWHGCDPAGRFVFNVPSQCLRSHLPGRGRLFPVSERASRLERRLQAAVKGCDYLLAHRLSEAMKELAPKGREAVLT